MMVAWRHTTTTRQSTKRPGYCDTFSEQRGRGPRIKSNWEAVGNTGRTCGTGQSMTFVGESFTSSLPAFSDLASDGLRSVATAVTASKSGLCRRRIRLQSIGGERAPAAASRFARLVHVSVPCPGVSASNSQHLPQSAFCYRMQTAQNDRGGPRDAPCLAALEDSSERRCPCPTCGAPNEFLTSCISSPCSRSPSEQRRHSECHSLMSKPRETHE